MATGNKMATLTTDEIQFLSRHGIAPSEVFDAQGLSKSEYRDRMKELGAAVACNVSACYRGGHSLRSRSGHCVQCNPAALAFQARHSQGGMVYVAHSTSAGLVKIGCAQDPLSRVVALNQRAYGGIVDWQLVYSAFAAEAGWAEWMAHTSLASHQRIRPAGTSGAFHYTLETFDCSVDEAVAAVMRITSGAPST
jgi:hypothetical protein